MEEKNASREGQHILTQLRSHEALSSWQVFRISRRKLTILNFSFCTFIGLAMGLLALYVDGSSVFIQSKREKRRKKQIDCRLFEVSPQEIASALLAAYEDFKAVLSELRTPKA